MRSKVSDSGVTLPREWFKGAAEVEIRREEHCVIVQPVHENDPIMDLGNHPIVVDVDDASMNHDRYLYGQ